MNAYNPRPGTVAYRLIAYFTQNPDEELTSRDIGTKFGVNHHGVPALLGSALDAGFLSRIKSADVGWMWRRGPNVPAPQDDPTSAVDASQTLARRVARPFSCALFSDGRMALQVGGAELTLLPTETTRLIRYLARMGDEAAA